MYISNTKVQKRGGVCFNNKYFRVKTPVMNTSLAGLDTAGLNKGKLCAY